MNRRRGLRALGKPMTDTPLLQVSFFGLWVIRTQKLQVLSLGPVLMFRHHDAECRIIFSAYALKSDYEHVDTRLMEISQFVNYRQAKSAI